MLGTNLGNKIFSHFEKSKHQDNSENPLPIRKIELDALQYLSGYVVKKFLKKFKNYKNYSSSYNQAMIAILESVIAAEDTENQKLIQAQSRGGLSAVSFECQQVFLLAERKFRVVTMSNPHTIHIGKITYALLDEPEVISLFNGIAESAGMSNMQKEIRDNLLDAMLSLYLRVRAFSRTKNVTTKAKIHSNKKKNQNLSIKTLIVKLRVKTSINNLNLV